MILRTILLSGAHGEYVEIARARKVSWAIDFHGRPEYWQGGHVFSREQFVGFRGVLEMVVMVGLGVLLDERPSKGLSEGIGDLDALLAQLAHAALALVASTAHWTSAHGHSGDIRFLCPLHGMSEADVLERTGGSFLLDTGRYEDHSDRNGGNLGCKNKKRKDISKW